MFAVTVTFHIAPGRMPAFLPCVTRNASASLEREAGCHRFDVATDPDRPDEVFLYELYTDAAAFEAHLAAPHFAAFDKAIAEMVASKEIRTYREVLT